MPKGDNVKLTQGQIKLVQHCILRIIKGVFVIGMRL
jgi:hypothetical protein